MKSYPARIRTWKNRTKTCCDTVSPPGNGAVYCSGTIMRAGRLARTGRGDLALGLLDLVGQVFELHAQVDRHEVHMPAGTSGAPGRSSGFRDPAGDHQISHSLGNIGRDTQDRQADLP